MLRHGDYQVDYRKRHQHDLKVLITEQGHEELKKTLRLVQYALGVNLDATLNGDMDLVNRRRAHLPVVRRVCHFEPLLRCDDASLRFGG